MKIAIIRENLNGILLWRVVWGHKQAIRTRLLSAVVRAWWRNRKYVASCGDAGGEGAAKPYPAPAGSASEFTYASKQATVCAVCGERKHTPLRNDEMGGYVCLTCIDRELVRLHSPNDKHEGRP